MADKNVVKFKITGLAEALSNQYVRVSDSATRSIVVFEGEALNADSEGNTVVDLQGAGTVGQAVDVYGDNKPAVGDLDYKCFGTHAEVVRAAGAITGITEIWVYGASISAALIDNYEVVMGSKLASLGYSGVTFVNKSIGGRGIGPTLSAWEAEKSAITGRGDILILTHCVGNSVSDNRPWVTLAQGARDSLISDYQTLMDSIVANGNNVMPVGTSFRNYDMLGANDEQNGSLPFNDAIVLPVLGGLPLDMGNTQEGCYLDWYNFTRNNYQYMMPTDGIHLTPAANQLNRNLTVEAIANRLLGNQPTVVERVDNPDNSDVIPREDITMLLSGFEGGSRTMFSANDVNYTTNSPLIPISGYLPGSVVVTQQGHNGTGGNNTTFDTGDTSSTLYNDEVKRAAIQTTSTTWVELQVRSGYLPNQEVEFNICAYRALGSASSRTGDYSIDGGATFITLDASPTSSEHHHTFNTQADANGEITLTVRVSAGSLYCHLSGTHAIPK